MKRPALSREYVRPSETHERINRPQAALCLLVGSVMGGSWLLSQLGMRELNMWIVSVVAIVCAGAGALYHPVNRFWVKGAISGFVAGVCALVATYYYLEWRVRLTGGIWSFEFVLSSLVGALPGVGLYVQLMTNEVVDEGDAE